MYFSEVTDFPTQLINGVIGSEDLSLVKEISMSTLCLETAQIQTDYPSVLHLSFSQNGEHLASASSDGHVRLWRLEMMCTLQELCRDTILCSMPVCRVRHLNKIPEK
ncbi:hypothetical protein Btru_011950 [Bulinus truncatus]|nr:hypothetical protein Btru_011950 [Bulinus truncatus]